MSKLISVAALIVLIVLLYVGWRLGIGMAVFIIDVVIDNWQFTLFVVLGSIAWVCFCALVYSAVERLIVELRRRSGTNG